MMRVFQHSSSSANAKSIYVWVPLIFAVFAPLIAIVFLFGEDGVNSERSCSQAVSKQEKQRRGQELEVAAAKLVQAFQKRDTKAFLELCSKNGISYEGDHELTFAQIRESLEKKNAFYCWLFDSECLRQRSPDDDEKRYSFHEVFSRDEGLGVLSFFMQPGGSGTPEDTCYGEVTVSWKGEPKWWLGGAHFTFAYEDGTWKLTGFDFLISVRE